MKNLFQSHATIESISTRADNTIKVVVGTQELPPEGMTMLFRLKGCLGWFLFSENEIEASEVPHEEAKEFKSDKSPSQRLRNTLFVYWNQNIGSIQKNFPEFNGFYDWWIEKKINEIKDKLV